MNENGLIDFVLFDAQGQIESSISVASEAIAAQCASDMGLSYCFGTGSRSVHYVESGQIQEYSSEAKEKLKHGSRDWHTWSVSEKDWIDNRSEAMKAEHLAASARAALGSIDCFAGAARLRYITSVPGQAETYAKKEQQARSWAAESFAGEAPSFIAAEARALGVSAQSVAIEVIGLADYWSNIKGPQIEATRRKWKVAIDSASDPSLIPGLVDAARAELDAL